MDNDNKFNETRNFYLAAAFMTLGAQYVEMTCDDKNPGRKTFHFANAGENPIDFAQITKMYTNGTLKVSALHYADAIKNLKSILHGSE